jgi:hypothetical protein
VLNAALGISYALSILALGVVAALYDDNYFPEPIAVFVLGGIIIIFCNILYTAGWVIELAIRWR